MNMNRLPQNNLLRKLPIDYLNNLLAKAELVDLEPQTALYERNQPVEYGYFLESGIVSVLASTSTGAYVEAAIVGNKGLVGLPIIFDSHPWATRAVCQVAGKAYRLKADLFLHEFRTNQQFASILLRYVQTFFDLMAQTSVCTHMHSIEERCIRWLLQVHDRTENDQNIVPLTQEFLAQLLGVRRSGVNIAIGNLKRANLLRSVRGKMEIVDRQGLEKACCECYRIAQEAFAEIDAYE